MYYPYLRGKQFELIALKELSDLMALNRNLISPIIEPVKITSTLKNTLKTFKDKKINFTIIINPQFGDLKNDSNIILEIIKSELSDYKNYQIGIIFEKTFKLDDLLANIKNANIQSDGLSLIHNTVISEENLNSIKERCESILPITNNIINFVNIFDFYN